jgi:predicted nucleic acid-binding protein
MPPGADILLSDALFVVLAERECCNLLTYDRRLLAAFSDIAKRPGQVLSP